MDSFFDKRVQAVLSTRKAYPGRPITFWEAAEEVTNRRHRIPGRKTPPQPERDDDEEQRKWRIRWINFANCYYRDPDFGARLFLAMTSFHAVEPKSWPLALKLAYLSALAEYEAKPDILRPAPPLRNQRKAEFLKKWFGNDIPPSRISIELSRERKRRMRIHAKWQSHYDFLNDQIEKRLLTPTSSARKL